MRIEPDPLTGLRPDPFAWRRVAPPPWPLAGFLEAAAGVAMLAAVLRHAEQIGGLLEEVSRPLRFLFGD